MVNLLNLFTFEIINKGLTDLLYAQIRINFYAKQIHVTCVVRFPDRWPNFDATFPTDGQILMLLSQQMAKFWCYFPNRGPNFDATFPTEGQILMLLSQQMAKFWCYFPNRWPNFDATFPTDGKILMLLFWQMAKFWCYFPDRWQNFDATFPTDGNIVMLLSRQMAKNLIVYTGTYVKISISSYFFIQWFHSHIKYYWWF